MVDIPEQAVKAFMDSFWGDASVFVEPSHVKDALTAAAPYIRYKREFNISSCTVDLSGADYKCFLDGVTGFGVSLDGETRSFGEYNEGDRVFFDAETGDLDALDLFILSRPAFEKKVQERISALPHMSASAREQALEEAAQIAELHEGEPCRPAIAWTDEERQFYASGQQDASSSISVAVRALKSQQNTETSAIEKKKFYHNEWPHDALMAARRDGFIDHNGGEAWRYQFTHKDEKGKYDLLYRDTSNSSIQAALPPAQTGGGE